MAEKANTVQESAVNVVHSADIVGNAFARQYYAILQQSPALVYRFYQDISKIGRVDGNDEVMGCTTTMDAINEKIQSYGSMKADIKFVDAQESYNGGVIVLVNGSMVNEDESSQKFTQTFFLAPQDKGYYVLNDIFRYVKDDDPENNEQQHDGIAPSTPSQAPPMPENHNPEPSHAEVQNPNGELNNPNGELLVEEGKEEVQVNEEEPVVEAVDEAPQESWAVVESSAKVEDAPKKSYASIVMKDAPAKMPSPTHPKSVSMMQDHQVPVAPASISVAVLPSSNEDNVEDGNNQVPEGESHSIYCRNLPMNVPNSRVEEVFQGFGLIKSGGIQIRHNKGFCFGFVEFETAAAAQSAIEASPVFIDGHKVVVEEKKSTATRGNSFGGNNRGRYPPGRAGSSFRGEGGRGRGGYGGGRGYGRGETNKSDFGGRGGGRGYQNRSDGYQRSDQTGNGFGRMNRGGGSAHEATRPQRVSAPA